MRPWTLLATSPVPGGAAQLRLLQRGDEFTINLDRDVLMGSRMRGSEEALARLGCARAASIRGARVLIGGLGMGFTLRAALDTLASDATVLVAELVPAVVVWARGPLSGLFGQSLADVRTQIREGDVGRLIRAAPANYDAILLDVDNGPDALTHHRNEGLYNEAGLRAAWTALRPGGVLSVWSAKPDPAFNQRLRMAGYTTEEVQVHAHGTRGTKHMIWLASRSGPTGVVARAR